MVVKHYSVTRQSVSSRWLSGRSASQGLWWPATRITSQISGAVFTNNRRPLAVTTDLRTASVGELLRLSVRRAGPGNSCTVEAAGIFGAL